MDGSLFKYNTVRNVFTGPSYFNQGTALEELLKLVGPLIAEAIAAYSE